MTDATAAFFRDPYRYISRRASERGTDVFQTRLLFRPTICMTGAEAARVFYDESRLVRRQAMPRRIRDSLLGRGGVQGLDGADHWSRKEMFLTLLRDHPIDTLTTTTRDAWRAAVVGWVDRVRLLDELEPILGRAAWKWMGMPGELSGLRTTQIRSLYDGAGAIGPRHWAARLNRAMADPWMASLVERYRAGSLETDPNSPFAVVSSYREVDGDLLHPRVAAVELLNLLRPIVAVSVYMTWVAHALALYPKWHDRLQGDDGTETQWFSQEVRRFYPFFPAVVAVAARDFSWHGQRFRAGQRVLLDIYGTNHDPRSWDSPFAFDPERFRDATPSEFDFIPQGGGEHQSSHRCPGEWIVLALMELAARFLTREMQYRYPPQRLDIDFRRLPALPRDRVILSDISLS